jgi:tetratricopeptide (TPR) repeat protein
MIVKPKNKKELIEAAEECVRTDNFYMAADLFEEAGEHERAKECFATLAKKYVAQERLDDAAGYYEKAGMTKEAKVCWIKQVHRNIADNNYGSAGDCYKKVGETDKAKECYTKEAENNILKRSYGEAGFWYAKLKDFKKAKECWIKEAEKGRGPTKPTIDDLINVVINDSVLNLAKKKELDISLEVLTSEHNIGIEEAKYKLMEIWVNHERYDVGVESIVNIGLTDKKLCTKFADKCEADRKGASELAAEFYMRGGKTEKANAMFIQMGDSNCNSEWGTEHAFKYYTKAGLTKEEAEIRIADKLFESGVYESAAKRYETLGNTEKTRLSLVKRAEQLVDDRSYLDAAGIYMTLGYSLSNVPISEKLLDIVKQGDPKAIQSLAKLVKTEEDEILFNEARARMVL